MTTDETVQHPATGDVSVLPPSGVRSGDVIGDRFELLALRGEGGMGRVYAALDRAQNQRVP